MNDVKITMETVRMFKRIMRPVAEEGIIPLPEFNEVISQLTSLAEHGKPKPVIIPRLVDMKEASEILGIGLSNFKKLEEGYTYIYLSIYIIPNTNNIQLLNNFILLFSILIFLNKIIVNNIMIILSINTSNK